MKKIIADYKYNVKDWIWVQKSFFLEALFLEIQEVIHEDTCVARKYWDELLQNLWHTGLILLLYPAPLFLGVHKYVALMLL